MLTSRQGQALGAAVGTVGEESSNPSLSQTSMPGNCAVEKAIETFSWTNHRGVPGETWHVDPAAHTVRKGYSTSERGDCLPPWGNPARGWSCPDPPPVLTQEARCSEEGEGKSL